jgi:hypothetical protein
MTSAFEKLKKQHAMTGSEKADGYSYDVFLGLDEDEKEAVFNLLVRELPWSAEWLFHLDLERALPIAKALEKELRGTYYSHAFMLQPLLVKYTGELIYQRHMIEDYSTCDDSLKQQVVWALRNTPANDATIKFFKEVILVDANECAVASASNSLLYALEFPKSSEEDKQNYRRLIGDLRSDSAEAKNKAIAELEKFAASAAR